MTKKSAGRILRDARKAEANKHLENNTIWDDLNGIYHACSQALGQHGTIALMLNRKEVIPFLKDATSVVSNIQALTRDILQMSEELKSIYAQHAGKTGGSDNPDDVIFSIQIFEQYHLFRERHDTVVMPVVYHILEEFNQAENRYNVAQAALQEAAAEKNTPVTLPGEFEEV